MSKYRTFFVAAAVVTALIALANWRTQADEPAEAPAAAVEYQVIRFSRSEPAESLTNKLNEFALPVGHADDADLPHVKHDSAAPAPSDVD